MSCPVCLKEFKTSSKLKRHLLIHGAKQFKCLECGKEFHRNDQLTRHNKTHSKNSFSIGATNSIDTATVKKFKCNHANCSKEYKSKQNLEKHLEKHSIVNVKCPKCSAILPKLGLPEHLKQHSLQCSYCQKHFKSTKNLKNHMQTHLSIEKRTFFNCEYCIKTFLTRFALKSHLKIVHDGLKLFSCDCGLKFGYKHVLNRHLKVCPGIKSTIDEFLEISSQYCTSDRTITNESKDSKETTAPTNSSGRLAIVLSGYESRPHKCYFHDCLQTFRRAYDLQRHLQSVHV